MKIQQRPSTTQVGGGIGEAHAFSITANGKAFRSLIDNVYSNKILAPVRELMTNAYDSHVAAGCPDKPFVVIVPTISDARFGVRDFGTSMSHETTVGLYTTLFASSKDDSNDAVGMLGLGSKSPFAYTDSFTVTTFDGTFKRVYTAYIDNDMPQLSLLYEGESYDERGILVEFPVKVHHIQDFKTAIHKTLRGFDVLPQMDGGVVETPQPVIQGDGWVAYRSTRWEGGTYVRQGCVCYPASSQVQTVPRVGGMDLVIDIPIGTADVAISREALSWDSTTTSNVERYFEAAGADMIQWAKDEWDSKASEGLVAQLLHRDDVIPRDWWAEASIPNTGRVSLADGMDTEAFADKVKSEEPGYLAYLASPYTSYGTRHTFTTELNVAAHKFVKILLMDDETPRRKSRAKRWGSGNKNHLMLPVKDQEAAVKRIKKIWNLDDSHFIKIADTPDIPRERTQYASPVSKSILEGLQEQLDEGAVWVQTHRGIQEYPDLAFQPHGGDLRVTARELVSEVMGGSNLVQLNRQQVEKLAPSKDAELSARVIETMETYVEQAKAESDRQELFKALWNAADNQAVYPLLDTLDLPDPMPAGLYNEVMHMLDLQGKSYEPSDPQPIIAALRERYPMCFPLDSQEMEEYVKARQTQLKENDQ